MFARPSSVILAIRCHSFQRAETCQIRACSLPSGTLSGVQSNSCFRAKSRYGDASKIEKVRSKKVRKVCKVQKGQKVRYKGYDTKGTEYVLYVRILVLYVCTYTRTSNVLRAPSCCCHRPSGLESK